MKEQNQKTRIFIFKVENGGTFPWRVTINGKADPRNRDFESPADARRCFDDLYVAGLIGEYTITTEE